MNPVIMILSVIGTGLVIWLVGSIVGRLRILIFGILRVERACEWIEIQLRKFELGV